MNTHMTSLLYYWLGSMASTHTHTHIQIVHTPFWPQTFAKEKKDSKSTECKKCDGMVTARRHAYGHSVTADVIDSALATAPAQGQLKEVRPCQSIQECWQTNVCECVRECVRLPPCWMSKRADLSPSQTLLIKAGNVCNLLRLA